MILKQSQNIILSLETVMMELFWIWKLPYIIVNVDCISCVYLLKADREEDFWKKWRKIYAPMITTCGKKHFFSVLHKKCNQNLKSQARFKVEILCYVPTMLQLFSLSLFFSF